MRQTSFGLHDFLQNLIDMHIHQSSVSGFILFSIIVIEYNKYIHLVKHYK